MSAAQPRRAVLRAGGAMVVVADDDAGRSQPRVVHWGSDLGEPADLDGLVTVSVPPVPRSSYDGVTAQLLLPLAADGWRGRPALRGARADGTAWSPLLRTRSWQHDPGASALTVVSADDDLGLAVQTVLRLHPSGVLEVASQVTNEGTAPYHLLELSVSLPLPARAVELLEPTGRWCRERAPQRFALGYGARVRESRHGRTGHDAPLVLAAGVPGFSWRTGELWALHLGWSGDAVHWAERHTDGYAALGAGELLGPGEMVLAPGETYRGPPVYAVHSLRGLDGATAAFHRFVRDRPSHPRRARPVVLNTWEAVYFDHRLDRLSELADVAAEVGVERFVLDDGWFRGRRDDTAGLGDWFVDAQVWPHGLAPLIDHVRGLGMEFGLWVEPEMVNPDSDLFRAHPDWVLGAPGRLPPPWRGQQVLDLARPEVYDYLLGRLDALLSDHEIAYLKWDQNRDLAESGHGGPTGVTSGAGGQVRAVYRLIDQLRRRHPGVEIESCASGGARVDLGILARTDRVWASDTNDPVERQDIQRWTGVLLPPELVGAHVGPPTAHTTGRTTSLAFRGATAFFGHFGMEWDLTGLAPDERRRLQGIVTAYKDHRALLHSGEVVRGDHHDSAADVHGVVAQDRSEAIFAYVLRETTVAEVPGAALLPGLDPDRRYRVGLMAALDDLVLIERDTPPWLDAARRGELLVSGRVLSEVGLAMPVLEPAQAVVLHLSAG